jgi:hypothetical protein
MKHKNSYLLVEYWSQLRKGREVPDQTDFNPRAIRSLISYTFIMECRNPSRPLYRLAGTALCERFGFELKGTGFLAHWDTRSGLSLTPLLRQSLALRQPVCIGSVASTADNGMVEMETVLTPISFNGGEPTRFFGLVQMLSDSAPLLSRPIAYQRLISSHIIKEGEAKLHPCSDQPPPPPPPQYLRAHPKAPYLKLVVTNDSPAQANCGTRSTATF